MNVDQRYQQVLEQISQGGRALVRFSRDELEQLETLLEKGPSEPVLCLIEHSATLHPAFEPPLIKLLNQELPDQILIFALNCARKHILQARQQRGSRLDFEMLETLKKPLHSPSPEVVEWTLRTIDECGSQGVYFLREFDKLKPPPWKWFNRHQRAVRELIEMFERRWKHIEKHKPERP